jgi:hypothetical protein
MLLKLTADQANRRVDTITRANKFNNQTDLNEVSMEEKGYAPRN